MSCRVGNFFLPILIKRFISFLHFYLYRIVLNLVQLNERFENMTPSPPSLHRHRLNKNVEKEHHRHQQENRNLASTKCNSKDIINCVNGLTVIDNTTFTCAEACAGECCVGSLACSGFTGYICKDTISCMGKQACQDANISSVLRGCNGDGAKYACKNAGADEGFIGEVIDSCIGKRSCQDTAREYGVINSTSSSCHGTSSCQEAAHYGVINSITSSCNGTQSCKEAGAYEGYVEFIADSCNADNACSK